MNNQDLNNQDSSNQELNNQVINDTPVEQKAPSVMRENIDENGNVIEVNNNGKPDMADKTINAVEGFIETMDHKSEFLNEDLRKYKTNAILCYLPFVSIYFLITSLHKKSKYILFHANQGLLITIMWVLTFFISNILSSLFERNTMLKNGVPGWVSFISYILYCICFLTTLFGIINTVNDSSKELPLIGKIKLIK